MIKTFSSKIEDIVLDSKHVMNNAKKKHTIYFFYWKCFLQYRIIKIDVMCVRVYYILAVRERIGSSLVKNRQEGLSIVMSIFI